MKETRDKVSVEVDHYIVFDKKEITAALLDYAHRKRHELDYEVPDGDPDSWMNHTHGSVTLKWRIPIAQESS